MYYVLTILLHRPFVADGHLYNTSRSISVNSFITCASAADSIVGILREYGKVFSVRHAPYLISYATYVAATIHVRIAAKRSTESEARERLETCMSVFRENQETNWAVRRAKTIVEGLMARLGVNLAQNDGNVRHSERRLPNSMATNSIVNTQESTESRQTAAQINQQRQSQPVLENESPPMGWSDIDGIIQSFVRGQEYNIGSANPGHTDAHLQQVPTGTGNQQLNGDPMSFVGNQVWVQGLPDGDSGAASVDDLLFGFNGSALDSLFY